MSEPKHPIEDGKFPFKTFLYLFDNDQIYDLLMFDRIDLNSVGYIPRSLLRSVKTASERVLLSEAEPRSVRGVAK
jgi:hypothetical protein